MDNKLLNIKDTMNKTVFRDIYFSDQLEQRVLSSMKNSKYQKEQSSSKHRFTSLLSLTVTAVFFLGISYFVGTQLHLFKGNEGNNASGPNGKVTETITGGTENNPSEKNPNDALETPDITETIPISKETVFSGLKKYLPQNVLDNMLNFREEGLDEKTLYLWSKKEPNSDNFIHKIEFVFNENGLTQYHYKNYSFELKENKISIGMAEKMVEGFAKDFISDGDQLSFVNKPAYDSLYEKGVVESWVAKKNNKEYIVMVNLRYGYVEFFKMEDDQQTMAADLYNVDKLLSEQQNYDKVYQSILNGTQSKEGAETFIVYLEALKRNDLLEVKKAAFSPERDSEIEALVRLYSQVNYDTLSIIKITPSMAEPSFEIQFTFRLNDSSLQQERTIHLNLMDEKTANIYEPQIPEK